MRALILSCNTGGGHNACAGAVQEALMARGIPCDIRDGLSFLSKDASRFISDWHVRLYRAMPKLYGESYSYVERHTQPGEEDSLVFRFLGLGAKSLRACVASQGYGIVVCTHLFPAMMLTQLQRQDPLPVVTAFIATDYTASPGYESICLDWCFVPAPELVPEFSRTAPPQTRVVASGIPVRRDFVVPGDKSAAKRALGIDPNHRHLLVMSGSMGCGPLKKIMKRLATTVGDDVEVSVICGTNRKLSRQLNSLLSDRENFHIHDYVDYIALFMDSADLYLTKPGGLSVSEALAKRLPMALIQAVEGPETYNMRYCLEAGAAATAEDPAELAALCVRLLEDPARLAAMQGSMAGLQGIPAAQAVCDCLCGTEAAP